MLNSNFDTIEHKLKLNLLNMRIHARWSNISHYAFLWHSATPYVHFLHLIVFFRRCARLQSQLPMYGSCDCERVPRTQTKISRQNSLGRSEFSCWIRISTLLSISSNSTCWIFSSMPVEATCRTMHSCGIVRYCGSFYASSRVLQALYTFAFPFPPYGSRHMYD